MPGISIITNFDVNANSPIDSRMVVNDTTARNSLQYLYSGLKVYQLSDKKTYLWDGSTWSLDSGFNGIYGGSGSLVGNTNVNFGTIGNTAGNTSNLFRYDTTTSTQSNRSTLLSYFRRHTNVPVSSNLQWEGIEFRHQTQYFNGSTTIDGPYISFNPIDSINSKRGGIAFATVDIGGSGTVMERLRISPDGYVGISTTDPKGQLQIGVSTTNNFVHYVSTTQSFIGTNWYWNSGDAVFNTSNGSSKLTFKDNGTFEISNRSANAATNAFTQSLTVAPNVVKIINDTSANDWDSASTVNLQLKTIPDYLHNSEHRYTKIQSENWYQLSSSAYDNTNKRLLITDDANNFEISVTASADRYITDIKILRNGVPRDLPAGSKINIRFKHSNTPSNNNFYIKLAETDTATSSNIRSAFSDEVFYGNTYSLRIEHYPSSTSTWAGDIITFVKAQDRASGPSWDVVNVDRQKQLWNYLKSISELFDLTKWDFTDPSCNIGYASQNPSAPLQISQWYFYAKAIGNTVYVDYQILVLNTSNGTVNRTGPIRPSVTNSLYGKQVLRSNFVPSIGFNGSGRGTGPFSTYTDYRSLGSPSYGFEWEIRRIDYTTNGATAFGTASWEKYLCGQFVMHLV